MGRSIDYDVAKEILEQEFQKAEEQYLKGSTITVPSIIEDTTQILFSSATQAFREALIGCILARIIDSEIDIRHPYMNQGENAFNGRTLDEKVVNPFLHDKMIPCSKGPYLSALRRNVSFNEETSKGLRDKDAFRALLTYLKEIEENDEGSSRLYLQHLLKNFIQIREASHIELAHIQRLSLEQFGILIGGMLQIPSGGLLPVLLSVAMFQTIKDCFGLKWKIEWQGINVSDKASGVGGDITIIEKSDVILAVEITERPIDRSRVVSTFNTKIAPHGINDYLFFFASANPTEEARDAARQYFAQGHDISFLPVQDWLIHSLGTIGPKCRSQFTGNFLRLLGEQTIPANLKLAWNDRVKALFGT
ncbi:MAG: restriction endonuclease, SacI family [Nitrospira sp.]|nr:restriction endonuclease, SacI family [Nitrospira sp.]